jgi:hypothetical protein
VLLAPTTSTATTASAAAARVPAPTAVDRSRDAGLYVDVTKTWSASTVDYNRDGAQDVMINYHGGAKLWKNLGAGRYQRVAKYAWPLNNARGRFIDRHNCAWADVDRNRRPDVYCSAGRTERNLVKRKTDNELWLQTKDGRFTEVGTAWGAGDLCGRGRTVVFLDANGDAYPDLFVGNDTPRRRTDDPCDTSPTLPNEESKIFINVNGKRFRYAPGMGDFGAGPGTRCAEVVDFDADGWDDLFTCGVGNEAPQLWRNTQGHGFVNVTALHGFDQTVNDATAADLDQDGDLDIVTATPQGFAYHLNVNGPFSGGTLFGSVPAGTEGRSVAVGDADGDGDNDVYGMVGNGLHENPDDVIWLNDAMSFTPLHVPSVPGAADDVVDLNPRAGKRAEFLVLNGRKRFSLGPIQLIRVIRR